MRSSCSRTLVNWIEDNPQDIKSIAIVDGSLREPELLEILKLFPTAEITLYGIENSDSDTNFVELDLNITSKLIQKTYDLVICAQVLEHVWNLSAAIDNLATLLDSHTGLLWVNCPSSNMVHGSPDYFSAGYSPQMLVAHSQKANLDVILSGSIGSRRLYFFTHALQYWPSNFELKHPIISYRPLRSYGRYFFLNQSEGYLVALTQFY